MWRHLPRPKTGHQTRKQERTHGDQQNREMSVGSICDYTRPMEHETIRGRLVYTSKKPAIMDKVRGGEVFAITKHIDGRRTLRAQCAIFENSPKVLRDTTTSLDAD